MPSSDALFDAAFTRLSDPELSQPPSSYLRAAGKMAKDFGQSVLDAVRLPGQVAGGEFAVKPETPGMWSEEDEYRQQRAGNVIESRAKDLAGFVTGGGYSAPAQRNATGMGIRAYHGSPHDFDRFDLSKIGTGEGAQVYGHGLYFAEKEGVAQAYRDTLAKNTVSIDGRKVAPAAGTPEAIAQQYFDDAVRLGSSDPMSSAISRMMMAKENSRGSDKFVAAEQVLRDWDAMGAKPDKLGRMYEVDINARPEQFLDWDKPLSREALDTFRSINPRAVEFAQSRSRDVMGQDVYKAMNSPANTSEALREAGIPGIKYLDQGSRGAGEGSRNYVVFDDKLVNILRKYGIAGGAVTGAATIGGNQAEAKDDFGAQLQSELQAIMAP
jgi:hypothetical protein